MAINTKDSELLKRLKPLRSYFIVSGIFSGFINMLMIVPAIYMLQVYDRAVGSQSVETLIILTLIMVFLMMSMGALDGVRGQVMTRASLRLDELLCHRIFDTTFKQSLISCGKSTTQPLSDLNGLRNFISSPTINALFDTPWIPFYILVMFFFHPYFGLMAVASAILIGTLTWVNQSITKQNVEEANKAQMWTNNFTHTHLRNAEVIDAMGMMKDVRARWHVHHDHYTNSQGSANEKSMLLTSSSKAIRMILQSLTLGLGAYLAINMEISPGMMIAGSILLGRALAPVDQLVGGWKGIQQAKQQFKRLDTLLTQIPTDSETMTLPAPKGDISVESVSILAPGERKPILKDISFAVKAGSSVGIIGPSAAGKSTLARLILGIWPPLSGSVRLDGADIHKWDRSELGQFIGYLPQDIELFDGTISENIARFGEISPTQVVEAAQLADVHEMILHFPNGYDTVIGATSGQLSAGQRQRIGLARALYGQPKLVVLDEPNSNLDETGEMALCKALVKLKNQQTTVIIISHRPNILTLVDKILVLNNGVAIDFGAAALIIQKYKQSPQKQKIHDQNVS